MWKSASPRFLKFSLIGLFQFSFFIKINAQPDVSFVPFLTISSPVDIVNSNDGTDRLFIVEQTGRIRVFKDSVRAAPFLDVRNVISTLGPEMGLLSIAFHPAYNVNRYFFIYYTTQSGSITSINIARVRTQAGNPYRADSLSLTVLLTIPKPSGQQNHNGGKLNFGPDGKLYFGTGDGGSGNDPFDLAQNGNSLLGKMLRIDVDDFFTSAPFYTIPPDNPFVSDASILDEIWAMGLRNPWRWSFDRLTNDVWIADVGQNTREEVNFRAFANSDSVNYGWRCFEGFISTPGVPDCNPTRYLPPIFDYPHGAGGGFSITGGYVYRGSLFPDLYGYYLTADYVSGNQFLIRPDGIGGWDTTLVTGMPGGISGFGESESGEIYAASLSSGTIFHVTATGPLLPLTLVNFTAKELNGYNELKWNTSIEENMDRFIIEYSYDAHNFQIAGEVLAMNNPSGYSYSFRHNIIERKKMFYRLKINDREGKSKYSPIISVGGSKTSELKIYPTIIKNNILNINTDLVVNSVKVYDMIGKEVYINNMNGTQGYFSIRLPQLAKGTYIVNIIGRDYRKTEKILIQ